MEIKRYLSTYDFAKKHNINEQTVRAYLRQHRIKGALRTEKIYLIPEDAEKPAPGDDSWYEYPIACYLTIAKTAAKANTSVYRIKGLIEKGQVEGVIQVGAYKLIPDDWTPPPDGRIKSSKYIGWRKKYGKNKAPDEL